MKIISLLLMIISVIALFGFGSMYLLGFAMSFDAPGSTTKGWGLRFLMFLPVLFLIVALIISITAFASGNYRRVILINIVPIGICAAFMVYMTMTSAASLAKYKAITAQEAKDAKLYPEQRFLRNVEGGTDTIIVFPSRIVAYRKYQGTAIPWAGPLGDLNEERTVITYIEKPDTHIAKDELNQFFDDQGRRFTDVYQIQ